MPKSILYFFDLLGKAIKKPKQYLGKLWQFILQHKISKSLFGHQDFIPFIILSRSRTGSNMLISLLDSHPNVHVRGEILGRLQGQNYKDILNDILCRQPRNIKAAGFKIFYYHPVDSNQSPVWDTLTSMENLRIIHLKRNNILRTVVSRKIAGRLDVWGQKAKQNNLQVADKTISFTVAELREKIETTRNWEITYAQKFANHSIIDVYYEDLVVNRQREYDKLISFLELPHTYPPQTKLLKQNPEKLSTLINNYAELKVAFANTEWAKFFED